jgi:hypothetical protein
MCQATMMTVFHEERIMELSVGLNTGIIRDIFLEIQRENARYFWLQSCVGVWWVCWGKYARTLKNFRVVRSTGA